MKSTVSRRLFTAAALVAVILLGFLFRNYFANSVMPPPERMQAETTQSYRYARMFSENGSIPQLDTLVMYPQGMRVFENSIFEEYVAGGMHRITGGDFDDFLRTFCLLFPLLIIPFLYLWMREAGFQYWRALAGAGLYAIMLPALLRARGESFYRETFALPVITALGWALEGGLKGKRNSVWLSGVLLFIALAAWKVTMFLSFFLFIYLIWRNWLRRDVPLSLRTALAAAQIAASLLLPHMRHDMALLSPAAAASVVLLIPPSVVWIPLGGTLVSIAFAFFGSSSTGHVSSVIAAKLRFFFAHPADPALLSPDARLFWVSGYTSPSPGQFLLLFGIPFALVIPGIRDFIRKTSGRLLPWFLLLAFAGYLFFDRLHVFLAVALVPPIAASLGKRWYVLPAAAVLAFQSLFPGTVAGLLQGAGLDFEDSSSLLSDREVDSLLLWMKYGTEEDDAFMSYWHISGLISAYGQRPCATNTFFESRLNRRKLHSLARCMFMPEDSLVSFMRRNRCDYLVYQADFLLDRSPFGLLYLSGNMEVPDSAVALKIHFSPEDLDSLVPVFQGPSLRVMALNTEEAPQLRPYYLFQERFSDNSSDYSHARAAVADPLAVSQQTAERAISLRDPSLLSQALLLGLNGGGDQPVLEQMLNDLLQLYINGEYPLNDLAGDVEAFLAWCGERTDLRLLLARLYGSENRFSEARDQYLKILEADPDNPEASAELQMITEMENGSGLR